MAVDAEKMWDISRRANFERSYEVSSWSTLRSPALSKLLKYMLSGAGISKMQCHVNLNKG